jgi:hypothetical protein
MTNRILHIELEDHSLVPAQAEVHVTVVPEHIDARTELRGRLMGPRCRFATTIEVAYHLRPLASANELVGKVIIPEASLWEPESPHLYVGPIELWQDGVRCDVAQVRHGLRHVAVGPNGLRLNGRLLHLSGQQVSSLNETEALSLRQAGHDLLRAPVSEESRHVWDVADQMGFFVLGTIDERTSPALMATLARHASCLGWLLLGEKVPAELASAPLLGVRAGTAPPAEANFVAVPSGEALPIEGSQPVLLMGSRAVEPREGAAAVLGTVEQ